MSVHEEPVLLPVTVLFGTPRRGIGARLVEADRQTARVELLEAAPPDLSVGVGVTLRPEGRRNLELVGVLSFVDGTRLEVEVSRAGHREDRWSPREQGLLQFRYLPARPGLDALAWADGGISPQGEWVTPDPRVELSLTGLAFLSPNPPTGALLFSFIHPDTLAPHRLVAEVVRADPTRRPGVYRVALTFVRVSESTGKALAEILLALQDAALESFAGTSTLDLPTDLPPADADVAEPFE